MKKYTVCVLTCRNNCGQENKELNQPNYDTILRK